MISEYLYLSYEYIIMKCKKYKYFLGSFFLFSVIHGNL